VTIANVTELNNYMTTADAEMKYSFNYFLGGVYEAWEESIEKKIADIGTERDPRVAEIQRRYALPGSSVAEEEALYEDRIRQHYQLTRLVNSRN
jgi:hypothetical protein